MNRYYGARQQRFRVESVLLILFVLMLLFAGIGLAMALSSSESRSEEAGTASLILHEQEFESEILVATREIERGTALEPQYFRVSRIPASQAPPKVVRSFEEIRGQFAYGLIVPETPISRKYLTAQKPSASYIAQKLKKGFRAATISVDRISSVEGWAAPGAFVDVLWHTTNLKNENVTVNLVENIKILSVNKQTDQFANKVGTTPSTITLELEPIHAQEVHFAAKNGTLTLSLRSDRENSAVGPKREITKKEILNERAKTATRTYTGCMKIGSQYYGIDTNSKQHLLSEAELEGLDCSA